MICTCCKEARYLDIPATYEIPYTYDKNGDLSIDYEMSEKDYKSYKTMQEAIMRRLHNTASGASSCVRNLECSLDRSWLDPIYQEDSICKTISYPSPSDESHTLSTSGMFPVAFYSILKFFGKSESLENLARIGNYGRWNTDKGTWWHYIDVMSRAYGLKASRLSNLVMMIRCMNEGAICPVLLDSSVRPGEEEKGNLLVIPIELRDGQVEIYSPAFEGVSHELSTKKMSVCEFVRNVLMIWMIEDPATT